MPPESAIHTWNDEDNKNKSVVVFSVWIESLTHQKDKEGQRRTPNESKQVETPAEQIVQFHLQSISDWILFRERTLNDER